MHIYVCVLSRVLSIAVEILDGKIGRNLCILVLCVFVCVYCVCVHTVQCLGSGGRCPQSSSQLAKSRLDPSRLVGGEYKEHGCWGRIGGGYQAHFYVSLQTMFMGGQLSTIFPRGVRLSSVRGC